MDRYLSMHPDIYIPPKKEAHFFATPDFPRYFTGPGDDGMNEYTLRTWTDYLKLFDASHTEKVVGESSVFYLYYPGTAKRIVNRLPDAKVLILLRNPVHRAYSAYMHLIRDGRETLSFAAALKAEPDRKKQGYEPMWLYRELGLYSEQVNRYFSVFGRERVHVVLFEEFTRQPQSAMQEVFRFLGVDDKIQVDVSLHMNESGIPKSQGLYNFISQPNFLKEWIKPLFPAGLRERLGLRAKSMVLRKEALDTELAQELQAYYAPDVDRLEGVLNRPLNLWR
ncbi:sulfotransferase [Alicyclobacillaceae bacterium I2511]|nr:sulfotransferase [Alicyclobacillaceae bacterium I2511]